MSVIEVYPLHNFIRGYSSVEEQLLYTEKVGSSTLSPTTIFEKHMTTFVIEVDDVKMTVDANSMVEAIHTARSLNEKRQTYYVTDTETGRTVTGIPLD